MKTRKMKIAARRLSFYVENGALARRTFGDGYKVACLVSAMHPTAKCGNCPAWMMPEWFSYLAVWIDDFATNGRWNGFVSRFAAAAHRWHALGNEGWDRLERRIRTLFGADLSLGSTESAYYIVSRNSQINEKTDAAITAVLDLLEDEISNSEAVDMSQYQPKKEEKAEAQPAYVLDLGGK